MRRSSRDDHGLPALAALHHRRGERHGCAALPQAGDVARRQDRRRPRRRRPQDRTAGRRPGATRAASAAAVPDGASALFQFLNTSKRSLVLDLRTEAGRASLAALLDRSHACLFEEPASIAPLIRAGKATPIEIAAFPAEMDAAARPVSELAIQALGGLMHMIGEPERKPAEARRPPGLLRRGPDGLHRPCRRARRARGRPARAACPRVAGRGDAVGELEGGIGRGRHRHLARPRRHGLGVPGRALPRRPRRRRLHRDAVARDAHPDRRCAAAGREVRHPRRPPQAHRRALRRSLRRGLPTRRAPRSRRRRRPRACRSVRSSRRPNCSQTEQYVARGFLAKMTHPDIGKLLIPQLPVQWNGRSFAPRPAPPLERAELAA